MDWKETAKKYWWIGAIILAILFLLRRPSQSAGQSTLARATALEGAAPTSDGIMEQTIQRLAGEEASRASRIGEAQTALALQQIKSQQELLGLQTQYEGTILRGQNILQQRISEKAAKLPFQCPPNMGTPKIDPETGRMFCRAKARQGNTLTDILGAVGGVGNILGGLGLSLPPIFGTTVAKPGTSYPQVPRR